MHPILNNNQFFVKEHTGIFKAANNFDVLNPETKELMLTCREENLGGLTKLLRFSDYKRMTPFHLDIKTPTGQKVVTVKRGIAFILSTVEVLDENDKIVGYFKQKFFSIGGKFDVLDANNQVLCTLQGKWTSWDFKFMQGNVELAHVSKKWAGLGKELFTSADNYMLEIKPIVAANAPVRQMILAAVMCIDMVLKE